MQVVALRTRDLVLAPADRSEVEAVAGEIERALCRAQGLTQERERAVVSPQRRQVDTFDRSRAVARREPDVHLVVADRAVAEIPVDEGERAVRVELDPHRARRVRRTESHVAPLADGSVHTVVVEVHARTAHRTVADRVRPADADRRIGQRGGHRRRPEAVASIGSRRHASARRDVAAVHDVETRGRRRGSWEGESERERHVVHRLVLIHVVQERAAGRWHALGGEGGPDRECGGEDKMRAASEKPGDHRLPILVPWKKITAGRTQAAPSGRQLRGGFFFGQFPGGSPCG